MRCKFTCNFKVNDPEALWTFPVQCHPHLYLAPKHLRHPEKAIPYPARCPFSLRPRSRQLLVCSCLNRGVSSGRVAEMELHSMWSPVTPVSHRASCVQGSSMTYQVSTSVLSVADNTPLRGWDCIAFTPAHQLRDAWVISQAAVNALGTRICFGPDCTSTERAHRSGAAGSARQLCLTSGGTPLGRF